MQGLQVEYRSVLMQGLQVEYRSVLMQGCIDAGVAGRI